MSLLAWRDLKNQVSTTEACREQNQSQSKEALKSHQTPCLPWQYVTADHFELEGKSYFVMSDYFSDLFELDDPKGTTLACVNRKLKAHFKVRYTKTV